MSSHSRRIYAQMNGALRLSSHGDNWGGPPLGAAIAFQVGDEPRNTFMLWPNAFTHAGWVSRKHEFIAAVFDDQQLFVERIGHQPRT